MKVMHKVVSTWAMPTDTEMVFRQTMTGRYNPCCGLVNWVRAKAVLLLPVS